jgi:hypothetical protein
MSQSPAFDSLTCQSTKCDSPGFLSTLVSFSIETIGSCMAKLKDRPWGSTISSSEQTFCFH